ncbi:peptidase M48 [Rhodoferax lacus]|uniref:Peptidase M48 n=2 Tax=Rhodoferax lacus TaxID=2184758 RepID=A0A3E1RD57_9BURK|nr:peptidase M48 [Rhodoferax lacus]
MVQALLLGLATLTVSPALPQVPGPQTATAGLPNLGDGSDMTPAAERRIGDRIARELYRDPDYLDDPVITDYVQGIWQPLIAAARQRGELPAQLDEAFAWEILMGRDRTVNAFALPGGYFGLHLGLVGIVTSRDELASVLAHEISHVTQRHISRSMARQAAQAPWLMGAMVLGMLAASKNPGAAQAAIVGGQAAAVQSQLNYSRDMEREADRIGFGVQTQAGFAPQGFVSMFEKLQQSSRLNDSGGFPYLRSHPLNTERIADMQSRVRQSERASTAPVTTLEHAMVAARARVFSDSSVDALRVWETQAQGSNLAKLPAVVQVGTLYGASFAALKQRDFPLAQATLARLQERVGTNAPALRLARLLALDMALAQGDVPKAQRLSQSLSDGSRATLLMRSHIDTLAGQGESAAQTLQTWLADHPHDAQAWQALAAANAAIARPVAAVRAEAEVNVAQLDYQGALTRFKAAQDMARKSSLPTDHIDASIVDTRARQMESLLREQALER